MAAKPPTTTVTVTLPQVPVAMIEGLRSAVRKYLWKYGGDIRIDDGQKKVN